MKNEIRENRLEDFKNYGYGLLRYVIMTLLTGAVALLYYEAGRMNLFEGEDPMVSTCESGEQVYNNSNNGFINEFPNENDGESYEK